MHNTCDREGGCDGCDKCGGFCCTKIENMSVSIGRTSILDNVSLHVHCGEMTAVIGPNGGGKSTLLKAIIGEIKHSGTLEYETQGVDSHPVIGYVPQHLNFDLSTPSSVLDVFTACLGRYPAFLGSSKEIKARAIKSLKRVDADRLITRRMGALSGGEMQRVLLALALEPVPNLLLLDEPSSGMDRSGLELFYKTVSEIRKDYDLSVILVSHDLEMMAKYADRVVLLNGSVLCAGKPKEVYESAEFKNVFGMSLVLPN